MRALRQRCLGSIGFCSFHNEIPDGSILERVNVLRRSISDDEVLGLPVRVVRRVVGDIRLDGERTDRVQLDKLVIPLDFLRQGDFLSFQRQRAEGVGLAAIVHDFVVEFGTDLRETVSPLNVSVVVSIFGSSMMR